MNWLKSEWSAIPTIQTTSQSEKKLSFKRDLSTNKKKLDTINTTLFSGLEKIKLELKTKLCHSSKELIFWMSKSTITSKDAKAFNLFFPIRKNPFQRQPILSTKHTVLSKRKNTISTNLMENSDISRVKTNNTKMVKLNYSKLTNTSMLIAKSTSSDIKNLS